MRSSLVFLGLAGYSVAAALTASASNAPVQQVPEPVEIQRESLQDLSTYLLHEVERIRHRESIDECAVLEPIPVYENSPSIHDWETYCEALVMGDAGRCDDVTGMLSPDLSSLCGTALHYGS